MEFTEAVLLWRKARDNERSRKWRLENAERVKSNQLRKRNKDPIDWYARLMFANAKRRALKKGYSFTVSLGWVKEKLSLGKCEVTGISFDFCLMEKAKHSSPWSPSLDRKDPSLGYDESNLQVVVWAYNQAKSDFSHEIVMKLARAVVSGCS